MYIPDSWVVLKIANDGKVLYKILAGWSGGYLHGNSWRINSGVVSVKETQYVYYDFYGESGSLYRCHQDSYGLKMSTAGIYETLQNQASQKDGMEIELMAEDTDWVELFNKGGDL